MPRFDGLFLAVAGRFPAAVADRLQRVVAGLRQRAERRQKGQAPPVYLSNHLRRDIGLPPVDHRGWPL
jgi:hypothetical protein